MLDVPPCLMRCQALSDKVRAHPGCRQAVLLVGLQADQLVSPILVEVH